MKSRRTFTILVSNAEDNMTQKQWAQFVKDVGDCILAYHGHVHFCGGSQTEMPWQNFCWVFKVAGVDKLWLKAFRDQLFRIRVGKSRDYVRLIDGEDDFI